MTTQQTPFQVRHWPFIDGLRGFAIVCVVLIHAGVPFPPGGYYGVELFFVLSGFLITALLLKEWDLTRRIDLRSFYFRRALRLVPALLLFLTVWWLYGYWSYLPKVVSAELHHSILYAFVYLTNVAWAFDWVGANGLNHTWTLAVEEQFYVLWPLILVIALNFLPSRRARISLVSTMIAGSMILRFVLVEMKGPHLRAHTFIDSRGDGLLIGCLVGMLVSWGLVPRTRAAIMSLRIASAVAYCALAYAFLSPFSGTFYYQWGLAVIAMATGIVIYSYFVSPIDVIFRPLEWRPLTWLGERSYGIYLWHLPLLVYPIPGLPPPDLTPEGSREVLAMLSRMTLTLGIAYISYRFIEMPFLRLKNRRTAVPAHDPSSVAKQPEFPVTSVPAVAAVTD
jgi:peptidoglycan/LPS O-acetylase OafA/YrhL